MPLCYGMIGLLPALLAAFLILSAPTAKAASCQEMTDMTVDGTILSIQPANTLGSSFIIFDTTTLDCGPFQLLVTSLKSCHVGGDIRVSGTLISPALGLIEHWSFADLVNASPKGNEDNITTCP
jgi:hypothetical protein